MTPPWEALVALGSTAMFGQPEWLITLLLCGIVPLTLLAAYPLGAARDQRSQSTALGMRHVRTASSTARRHESGPARPSLWWPSACRCW